MAGVSRGHSIPPLAGEGPNKEKDEYDEQFAG